RQNRAPKLFVWRWLTNRRTEADQVIVMRRPSMYRGLRPKERALLYPVFRAALPPVSTIAIGDGLGFGDAPWTDWGTDSNYPAFYYKMNVGDYAFKDLSATTWTPYGSLCDILIHEMTHVWQYA